MGIGILYFFVILIVISTGAVAGISGGVILRPVFDLIGYHNAVSISFYMAVAVLTMAISSTMKQISLGTKIDFGKVLTLALGSITGGFVGQSIFNAISYLISQNAVQILQGILSIALLIFVFMFTKEGIKTYQFKSKVLYLLIGFVLGTVASILAIGGGPINVIAFMILFGITIKEATVYSITTIFFTQVSRLIMLATNPGFATFDLGILVFVVPAAIMGGIIGGRLNVKMPATAVLKVFKGVLIATILLNIFNVVNFWLNL